MTGFTYEYTVADTADSENDKQSLQQKVNQGNITNETLVKDLKRSFKLEGYVLDRENNTHVDVAIEEFHHGLDPYQKALMNESQGLLKPSAELVGARLLKPKCDLLLYERLPDGKFPIPKKDQIYVRKDPKDPRSFKLFSSFQRIFIIQFILSITNRILKNKPQRFGKLEKHHLLCITKHF